MKLSVDEKKKQDVLRKTSASNFQYRFYKVAEKLFSVLLWALPLAVVVIRVLGHALSGSPMQGYQYVSTIIICVALALGFIFGKWVLHTMVNALSKGGFSQENTNESLDISANGSILYSHTDRKQRNPMEELIFPEKIDVDETHNCVVFRGRIETYAIQKDGNKLRRPDKTLLTIYDYFTPSLIDTVQNLK